jgi:hypothetical protein
VVSDQTPWRDVQQRGAGWCLPLGDRQLWCDVLQQCIDMDQGAYQFHALQTKQYLKNWATSNDHFAETVQLFKLTLARRMSSMLPRCVNETIAGGRVALGDSQPEASPSAVGAAHGKFDDAQPIKVERMKQ